MPAGATRLAGWLAVWLRAPRQPGVVTGRTRAILQKGARTPPNDIITAAEPIHPLNPAKHLF